MPVGGIVIGDVGAAPGIERQRGVLSNISAGIHRLDYPSAAAFARVFGGALMHPFGHFIISHVGIVATIEGQQNVKSIRFSTPRSGYGHNSPVAFAFTRVSDLRITRLFS